MKKLISFLILALVAPALHAAAPRVAILGDSIAYGGRWPTLVESALRATPDFADAEIVNFGLPSENVSGLTEEGHAGGRFPRPNLHERLERVLDGFKPTLVLACYGMNDGIYLPLDAARMKAFQDGMVKLKAAVEKRGARIIFITAPLFKADDPAADANHYDAVLDAQAQWLVARRADGWEVVDIRPDLKKSVAEAKRVNPKFIYAGDGVHPGNKGHDFIADSICKQLWPLLKLPGSPRFAEGDALAILGRRNELLKLAWLTKTHHTRPEIPAGLPLDEANVKAAKLLEQYHAATPKVSVWNGYERLDFTVGGRAALLVHPQSPAPGSPWIWRTEFFGHEPQADIALLGKGFHVAYMDLQNLYGAPVAMEAMDQFYDHLTGTFGLAKKSVLEGFSRGGLFAFNWAALHPDRVAGLYVDAPVCDFKSWPGGKGGGPGSTNDWQNLLKVYGFTEAQALAYDKNPVDNLAPMALAHIPIFAVIGAADEVVPVSENIDLVEKRYQTLGGKIEVIRKPGGKHHPHSLRDPAPIVDFVVSATAVSPLAFYDAKTAPGAGNFNTGWPGFRACWEGRQKTFAATFEADQGAVVFLGDSITEQNPLPKLFPNLHTANRGISGDTSRGMVYRLSDNVLELHPKAVVLLCGANDMMQHDHSPEGTATNVKTICEAIHARLPGITVFVLKIMPCAKVENATVATFNDAVDRAIAGLAYVVRVDTYSPYLKPDGSADPSGFLPDGVHLNAFGYEIYRRTLAPFLSPLTN